MTSRVGTTKIHLLNFCIAMQIGAEETYEMTMGLHKTAKKIRGAFSGNAIEFFDVKGYNIR